MVLGRVFFQLDSLTDPLKSANRYQGKEESVRKYIKRLTSLRNSSYLVNRSIVISLLRVERDLRSCLNKPRTHY